MSDYLSRAATRATSVSNGVRPKLPSLFDPPAAFEAQVPPATERETIARPNIRERVGANPETVTQLSALPSIESPAAPKKIADINRPAAAVVPPIVKLVAFDSPPSPNKSFSTKPTQPTATAPKRSTVIPTPAESPRAIRGSPAAVPATPRAPNEPLPVIASLASKQSRTPRGNETAAPSAIHVTIGRVEVRAVQSPPPVVREPQPRPAPRISLDEYLRARNGNAA